MAGFRPSTSQFFARIAALCIAAAAFLCLSAAFAHEGHDHDDSAKKALIASTYPRVTAKSELYELVGILRDGRLVIYLDHSATNEPAGDAQLKVTIGDREPIDAKVEANASYSVPFPPVAAGDSLDVVINISARDGDDLLVGALTMPEAAVAVPQMSPSFASLRWLAGLPSSLRNPMLLAIVIVGLVLLFTQLRRRGRFVSAVATGAAAVAALVVLIAVAVSDSNHQPVTPAPATIMSDAPRRLPDGTAFVAKPSQRLLEVRTAAAKPETVRPSVNLIGRVIGDPNRTSVVQSVHGGRILPLDGGMPRIGQTVRKGDVLVHVDPYLPLADRTTISEKSGEIEQLIAVAEMRIRRLRPLAERGAVPQSQVNDLETELEGLRLRRETVRKSRTEPELLRASTDGVIAAVKVVAGQVVQAQDIIFQIIDPMGLWIEALAYGDVDPNSFADATAETPGGLSMLASYQGFSRALQQHATVVQFAIPDAPANLSVGQPVTVMAKSGAPVTGLLARRDAVTRSTSGEAIVWLHVEPERFEPRPVRTEPFDAAHLIVASGIAEDERIVVRGADLINQIR